MSMIRPIGVQQNAFDATNPQFLSFTSVGGEQVVKNKLTIRLNTTNEIVYENIETTYTLGQIVPKNTLTNGLYYNFSFVTYNVEGDASEESVPIPFYCYTTPTIVFNNVIEGQTISNASYRFTATYSQEQGEYIDFIKFYLYDVNNNLINSSENLYSTENPPITFSYSYEGFENNSTYKIKAIATSINGTVTESEIITFNVVYINPILFSTLDVENKCDDGYNQITSNMVIAEGISSPSEPDYVDNDTKVNLTQLLSNIKWEQGYSLDKDFVFELWYGVGLLGKQFKLINKDNDGNYFIGKLVREIPYGDTKVKDYIEIIGYIDNVETFYMRSNYVDMVNNTSSIVLWFKFNQSNNNYELILDVLRQDENVLEWNSENTNAQYNRVTTLQYNKPIKTQAEWTFKNGSTVTTISGDELSLTYYIANDKEEYKQGVQKDNKYGDMSQVFPIERIEICNGVYDNIDISTKTTKQFTTVEPIWDYCTVLNCDFNGNINGGNVNILLSQLNSVRIKAREYGDTNWITLYDIPVNSVEDLFITKQDYRTPVTRMEYALVPVLNGGAEGDYITTTIDVKWNRLFVSDSSGDTMSLISGISYGDTMSNSDIATLNPINAKYPIVVQNGETDYESGTISGNVIQEGFINKLDRVKIVELNKQWTKFLKNGKTKVIKDWNGNIWIARVSTSPSRNYNSSIGNGFGQISFAWVEQGKWNNQEDLYRNNITNIE